MHTLPTVGVRDARYDEMDVARAAGSNDVVGRKYSSRSVKATHWVGLADDRDRSLQCW